MTEVHKQVVTCRSEEKLRAARAALGAAAVHLVRVNSGRGDPASVLGYGGAWREGTLPGTLPQGGAGEPPSRPPTPAAVLTWANFPPLTAPHPGRCTGAAHPASLPATLRCQRVDTSRD